MRQKICYTAQSILVWTRNKAPSDFWRPGSIPMERYAEKENKVLSNYDGSRSNIPQFGDRDTCLS